MPRCIIRVETVTWQGSTESSVKHLLYKIETNEGTAGFAEVPGRSTWSESTAEISALVIEKIFAPLLEGIHVLGQTLIEEKLATIRT